jgi:branched-subunit amino acid aminotransferase/4-amino-4-deoxychorismate lyase
MPEADVRLLPFCRGLQYGDGLFETVRVYSGSPFRLNDHLQRLNDGLERIGITGTCSPDCIRTAIDDLLRCNGLTEASVKIIAVRRGEAWIDPDPGAAPELFITARPFDAQRKRRCEQGISACIVSPRRNNLSPVCALKSLNYLENILGRREARDNGADEALFLNTSGFVAEGALSNIFILKNSMLHTPPLHAGILRGITRDIVLGVAAAQGIACGEADISTADLFSAAEAFCTNSVMEIMPLLSVNTALISGGMPGPLTQRLMRAYTSLVAEETV